MCSGGLPGDRLLWTLPDAHGNLWLGYNIGVAVFGGCTPLVATWLIRTTGLAVAPSFWVILAAVVSLAALGVIWRRLGMR